MGCGYGQEQMKSKAPSFVDESYYTHGSAPTQVDAFGVEAPSVQGGGGVLPPLRTHSHQCGLQVEH